MAMSRPLRKLVLTAHVVSSVGWLGTVATFLVLAVSGLTDGNTDTVRACYLAMKVVAWTAIVPSAGASLLTGVVISLGTPWGLFRHYWVLAKLLITLFATGVLLLHTRPIGHAAAAAASGTLTDEMSGVRLQLVVTSAGALVMLLFATALATYKPRGLTAYGWRKQQRPPGIAGERPGLAK